jgi:quercetin dioxygenase-like cupin family protein
MSSKTVTVKRWSGGQHPSVANITKIMQTEKLRPYMWYNSAGHRYAVRSINYDKVLFVAEGSIELTLPDTNEFYILRAGDRADIPAGVRHGTIVGKNGAKCIEASSTPRVRSTRS